MRVVLVPLLLVPFFGWGVYALQRRYRRHEEFSLSVEATTLLCLLLFYVLEVVQLREMMKHQVVLRLFALLGLFVAGIALYGHMAVSLGSKLIVSLMSPGGDAAPDQPRFAAAEMLERQRDYEGALQEYMVLARIFRRHPEVLARIADTLVQLKRPEEAAQWFERALKQTKDERARQTLVNRLCELYEHQLSQPEEARRLLREELERVPEGRIADSITTRMGNVGKPKERPKSSELEALEETSLDGPEDGAPEVVEEVPPAEAAAPAEEGTKGGLAALDDAPIAAEDAADGAPMVHALEEVPSGKGADAAPLSVEAIDAPLEDEADDDEGEGRKTDEPTTLEPM